MRVRVATILSLLLICLLVPVTAVHASATTFAQEADPQEDGSVGEEDETQQGEGGNLTGNEEGQSDPDAETGAGEGEQEGGESAEEQGPPWTYQMARIGIVLMILIGLLMGLLYYRMIASRQRPA